MGVEYGGTSIKKTGVSSEARPVRRCILQVLSIATSLHEYAKRDSMSKIDPELQSS